MSCDELRSLTHLSLDNRVKSPAMLEALTAFKEKRAPNYRQFD